MTKKKAAVKAGKMWMSLEQKIDRDERFARAGDRRMLRDIKFGIRIAGHSLLGTELAEILEIVQVAIGRKTMADRAPRKKVAR